MWPWTLRWYDNPPHICCNDCDGKVLVNPWHEIQTYMKLVVDEVFEEAVCTSAGHLLALWHANQGLRWVPCFITQFNELITSHLGSGDKATWGPFIQASSLVLHSLRKSEAQKINTFWPMTQYPVAWVKLWCTSNTLYLIRQKMLLYVKFIALQISRLTWFTMLAGRLEGINKIITFNSNTKSSIGWYNAAKKIYIFVCQKTIRKLSWYFPSSHWTFHPATIIIRRFNSVVRRSPIIKTIEPSQRTWIRRKGKVNKVNIPDFCGKLIGGTLISCAKPINARNNRASHDNGRDQDLVEKKSITWQHNPLSFITGLVMAATHMLSTHNGKFSVHLLPRTSLWPSLRWSFKYLICVKYFEIFEDLVPELER